MRRVFLGIVAGALLVAGAAVAATPATPAKGAVVKGEEQHHLLMLDMKEATQHASALHHYAMRHEKNLDKAVVMKHVEELTRNLDGVQTNLADLEQSLGANEKAEAETRLATVRSQEQSARADLDILKAEVAKESPSATVIAEKSKAIYTAMSAASEHHHKMMVKRGVHEPTAPPKS